MERLFIPHLSVPGDDTTFRGNAIQSFWHKVLFTFQIDEIDAPGGLPKTPVTCADWRIVPPSCLAASQRVQQPSIEAWPDCNPVGFGHQVRTHLEPIS